MKQFAASPDKAAQANEKVASLTNTYNEIVITTVLNAYPVESIFEIKKPFETKAWSIGGTLFVEARELNPFEAITNVAI